VRPYAVVVDGVDEVAILTAADIAPPPDFGGAVDVRFITGMARREAGVTTLIDLDAVATADRLPETVAVPPS
jgi:purine-binding chemotaxis protein CheW